MDGYQPAPRSAAASNQMLLQGSFSRIASVEGRRKRD